MTTYREQLEIEQRAMMVGIYVDIALSILLQCKTCSKVKLLFLMFLCKSITASPKDLVNSRKKKDLLKQGVCHAGGRFEQLQRELPYIVDALALLVETGCVADVESGYALTPQGRPFSRPMENRVCSKLVDEALILDDAYVVLEVVRNV